MSTIPGVRYRACTSVNKPAQLFKRKAIVNPRPFYLPKSSNSITQFGSHNRFYKRTHVVQKESGVYQEQTADIYIDGYDGDDGEELNTNLHNTVSYENVDDLLRAFNDTEIPPTAVATVFSRPTPSMDAVYSPVIKDPLEASMSFSDEEEDNAGEYNYVNTMRNSNHEIEMHNFETQTGNEVKINYDAKKRQTVFLTFGQYIVPPAQQDYKGHSHVQLDRITEADSQSQNTVSSFSDMGDNTYSKPDTKEDHFLLENKSDANKAIQSKENPAKFGNEKQYDHRDEETKESHFSIETECLENKLNDKTTSAESLDSSIVSYHSQGVELQSIVPKIEVTRDAQSKSSFTTQMSSSVDSGNISLSPGEEADEEDTGEQTQVNSRCQLVSCHAIITPFFRLMSSCHQKCSLLVVRKVWVAEYWHGPGYKFC